MEHQTLRQCALRGFHRHPGEEAADGASMGTPWHNAFEQHEPHAEQHKERAAFRGDCSMPEIRPQHNRQHLAHRDNAHVHGERDAPAQEPRVHGHLRLVDARCGECAVAPQAQRHANGAAERIGDDIVDVADTVCARIEMEEASELGDLDTHRCGAAHRYSHPRRQPEEPCQEETHRHEQHDVHTQLQDRGHTVGADVANELQRVELRTQMVRGAQ